MNSPIGRLTGAITRVRRMPQTQWPQLFQTWLPELPETGAKERDRIYPRHILFWLLWMTKEAWMEMPETFQVREVSLVVEIPGFRTQTITIVTTLLGPKDFTPSDLADLYRRRWLAELFLRDIKISMGMDVLRCKSPEMIEREVSPLHRGGSRA